MRAVLPYDPESSEIRIGELDDPKPAAGEVLVEVRAAGINHADLL